MSKAALIAVPHNWDLIGHVVQPLAPRAFSRVCFGNTVEALASEKNNDDPLVVLIGGAGTPEVLREVLQWRDTRGEKRVRWVHSYWTGIDAFQVTSMKELFEGVPLSNARGVFSPMLAEHVVLSILYFNRQVWRLQRNRKAKTYDRFPCIDGADQKVGIIGYGDIGRTVAKHVRGGIGADVIGLRTRPADVEVDDLGVRTVHGEEGLDTILTSCDAVVAILPLTSETRGKLRREHFDRMKETAVFVNIGRGATVVEEDLVNAIKNGKIKGAALDVFAEEPLPSSSPLWELDDSQLLLSPHNADISEHSYADGVKHFATLAHQYADSGKLPDYLVDLERGY